MNGIETVLPSGECPSADSTRDLSGIPLAHEASEDFAGRGRGGRAVAYEDEPCAVFNDCAQSLPEMSGKVFRPYARGHDYVWGIFKCSCEVAECRFVEEWLGSLSVAGLGCEGEGKARRLELKAQLEMLKIRCRRLGANE